MSITDFTRRQALMAAGGGILGLSLGGNAFAQQAGAQVVYADGAQGGWTVEGWAEQEADFEFDGQKVVKVKMNPFSGLVFKAPKPVPTKGLQSLTILLHGGETGEQEARASISLGRKPISQSPQTIKATANQWARYDLPFKSMRNRGAYFDTILIQNLSPAVLPEFYVNFVILQ